MRILYDLTMLQHSLFNGASEYALTVFMSLLSSMDESRDIDVFGLYSSKKEFKYKTFIEHKQFHNVKLLDYENESLANIVKRNNIDKLFIACGQSFCELPLGNLSALGCKVLCVVHDLVDEDLNRSNLLLLSKLSSPYATLRHFLANFKRKHMVKREKRMLQLLNENDISIITVSEYSRSSIAYHYPQFCGKIKVMYPPAKTLPRTSVDIENKELKKVVENKSKYLLIVSANRIQKNAERALKAFNAFTEQSAEKWNIVTVGYPYKTTENHIALPFLSANDLDHAYRNCYALLYPSLFEGFGYPPIEAMRYNKPVLCSYICSIPEVLQQVPIYFSPIYEASIFNAIQRLAAADYSSLCEKSKQQYEFVSNKQEKDLSSLTNILVEE